ncbi:hypothetical protein K491DRAFT_714972 [Lophiostoma macrostomum CBS 122681]|uniref:Uncharacterized protein n=1 Tax=Lophiostoma macrostomum CBS 122681 TaxID=1314788 RepID=A0A6A6TDG3_9PLEO|nr:hypothetical protein K491DRAFT_714972 [Lophiostoma macrostomum CBS 122681]
MPTARAFPKPNVGLTTAPISPSTRAPLNNVPIHLVAHILAHLDCISDLWNAIHSHGIFESAFNDLPRFVTKSVLTNQIPRELLPFAWALHESKTSDPRVPGAVENILRKLESAIANPDIAVASLAAVPITDALVTSEFFTTVQDLCQDWAKDVVPVLHEKGIVYPSEQLSHAENFRLSRAFYRYELLCKSFARRGGFRCPEPESATRYFFDTFSPWVTEQLLCAYTYLERKVYIAFDEVAAHDVAWGELPVQWDIPAADCPHLQDFLACGLQFVDRIRRAQGYDEWIKLLRLEDRIILSHDCHISSLLSRAYPGDNMRLRLSLDGVYAPLKSYTPEQFDLLAQASDGEFDGIESGPCRIWSVALAECSMFEWDGIACLPELGYTIWDYPEFDAPAFSRMVGLLSAQGPYFRRVHWIRKDVQRSLDRRADIWLVGGEGYWALNDYNFDRVRGLSEESKKRLVKKWRGDKGSQMLDFPRPAAAAAEDDDDDDSASELEYRFD